MLASLNAIFIRLARDYIFAAKIVILAILTLMASASYHFGIFDRLENFTLDQRFRLRPPLATHPKIILVEIAEDSIESIGRWPWDREWHALAIKALKDLGAKSVAFDILFSEPSEPATDTLLAKVIAASKNTYIPIALHGKDGTAWDVVRSIPEIREAAKGEGHIAVRLDPDGVLRRIPAQIHALDQTFWQIGFLLAFDYLGINGDKASFSSAAIRIPVPNNQDIVVPLTPTGDIVINWPGRWKDSFQHVSFVDVVASYEQSLKGEPTRIPVEMFKDSLCVIGVSATALFDIKAAPLEPAYPAMGVNAVIANSVLQRAFMRPLSAGVYHMLLVCLSLIIFVILWQAEYARAMFSIVILAATYLIVTYGLFVWMGIILQVAYPLFLILVSYMTITAYHQIVISIERQRLMRLATTDPLTGLYNIGHFKRLLSAEISSTRLRSNKNLCVVMIDGDRFKSINDKYGHPGGDEVLRGMAEVLRSNCRALDVAARYGGEEFIMMLPGAPLDSAVKVAEKMRQGIEQKQFHLTGGSDVQTVTASFGVAQFEINETIESLLKRADQALYQAKNGGRNCVHAL